MAFFSHQSFYIMKKSYLYLSGIIFLVGITLSSCKKFDYYQINPNTPTQADPSLELANIEQTAFATINTEASLATRQLVYAQSSSTTQNYGWQRADSDSSYKKIAQVVKMEQEAARIGKPNYKYLGKFFRSYYIVGATLTFGDVPYAQAMQALNNNFSDGALRPVYDAQEDIYLQVLNDLKLASDSLSASGGTINNDIIYNGDITQWKKAINTFSLRVLMSLSKKEANTKLNIKQRFNDIVSNPSKYPLLTSNDDNAKLTYYDIVGNRYPYNNNNSLKTDYYLDDSFVKMLKDLKDPRLFVYASPTPNSVTAGLSANNFSAYTGLIGSAPVADNLQKMTTGNASAINRRYAYDAVNEPSVAIGYPELQFILAEAVARGWIAGDMNKFYTGGIRGAMLFSRYKGDLAYTLDDIETYLKQPSVTLQSGTLIPQIIMQRYINTFMNTGWQSFYEQRRTGFPTFETAGAGILNGGKIPKRWMYPTAELNNNGVNVDNAIKRQYPGGDDINGVMWLLQ